MFVTMNEHTYNHSKRYLMMLCFFFQGFGEGNFKALFEAIELEQAERGNLLFILYRSFQGRLQDF